MTLLFVTLAVVALAATAWRGYLVTKHFRERGNALTGEQGRRRQVVSLVIFAVFSAVLIIVLILQSVST